MSTVNKKILKILARRIIKKYRPKIIGIAGGEAEVGTRQCLASTKEMIGRVLASQFSARANKNLFNDETDILLAIIGVDFVETRQRPVSTAKILMKAIKTILIKQDYPEFLILETKTDQAGKIKSLFKVARPEVGIIIGTGRSANGKDDSFKQSVRERNLMVKCLRKNELAVLNCDDEATKNIIEGTRAKVITLGFNEKADVKATEVSFEKSDSAEDKNKEEIVSFKINYQNSFVPIHLTRRQIYPALAAAAVGLNYGLNLVEIASVLSDQEL